MQKNKKSVHGGKYLLHVRDFLEFEHSAYVCFVIFEVIYDCVSVIHHSVYLVGGICHESLTGGLLHHGEQGLKETILIVYYYGFAVTAELF